MPSLDVLIVDAVQVMLVQRCIELDIDPEISVLTLFRATNEKCITLRFAQINEISDDVTTIAEIIGDQINYIEYGCFGRTSADEAELIEASRHAITMLWIAARARITGWEDFVKSSLN